tara:strand:- start:14368 stop:15597 length:1230 start_codon:yes stop_codon:yes gene_type:complete
MLGNPGNLFGSSMMPRPTTTLTFTPPTPAPAPRPPAPTSAANLQTLLALSGQDRANAFLKGLGAMGPALIAAGAPSTDPGARQRNIALAGQLRAKATQDDLARQRAANVQALNTQIALQKAAQEKALFNMKLEQNANLQRLLGGGGGGQQQGQAVQPQPMANVMSGPEPMVMPTAVQTPQATTGQTNLMNSMAPEMRASLLAAPLDQRAKLVFDYVTSALDPNKDFNPVTRRLNQQGIMKAEDKMRGELKPIYNKISETNRLAEIAEKGLNSPDGSGHISGLTAMIKMIDPGMVTSGELQLQQSATDAISRANTIIDNWKEGTVLDPELRTKMVGVVADLKAAVVNAYRPQVRAYKAAADLDRLRWKRIWMGDAILNRPQTGNTPTSTLKRKPNQPSIKSRVPGLEPVK